MQRNSWFIFVIGLVAFSAILNPASIQAQTGMITTVAGGGIGDNGPATDAVVRGPQGVAIDGSGNVYVADTQNHVVRKIDTGGDITTFAGSGGAGYSGDNGPAAEADLNFPRDVFWFGGELYIADSGNDRVRKVDSSGDISTVAGNGESAFGPEDGPATMAGMHNPTGIFVDGTGLYIAVSNRIAHVDGSGILTVIAGDGTGTGAGDGGPATMASLRFPQDVARNTPGEIFIADSNRIRKVDTGGDINTIAGMEGSFPFGGPETGPATAARLATVPSIVVVDSDVYFVEQSNFTSRVGSVSGGIINTVAGDGTAGFAGDAGPATLAQVNWPAGITMDSSNDLYIGDQNNHRIRKITGGEIFTLAGNGTGFHESPATEASLFFPQDVAIDNQGNMYIADERNHRVRKVDTNGDISTVAGTGTPDLSGDDGPATMAALNTPTGIAVDGNGNLYIADRGNQRIRMVDTSGDISTYAGGGGTSGADNVPATEASLNTPSRVAADGAGNLFIADRFGNRVYRVDNATQIITIFVPDDTGLGSLADLAIDGSGNVYIVDIAQQIGGRIWKVDTAGDVSIYAGGGNDESDGIPATTADLGFPTGIDVDADGNVYISVNDQIRKIDAGGIINTVAGAGKDTPFGDNGPATLAQLNDADGIALNAGSSPGDLFFADKNNHRIRKIEGITAGSVTPGTPGGNGPTTGPLVETPGIVTTLAGGGDPDFNDGPPFSAYFNKPIGVDVLGNVLFVGDAENNRIRRVDLITGEVSTIAGSGTPGFEDGIGTLATFNAPLDVKVASNFLYVSEADNHAIRRINLLTRNVVTVAGNGSPGSDDGIGTAAQFNEPIGLAVTEDYLYVADSGNNRIRRVDHLTTEVTTVAGDSQGADNGIGTLAQFNTPIGLALWEGYLLVADAGNNHIRKIALNTRDVTTIAGIGSMAGFADDVGSAARFSFPAGIAVRGKNLIIADGDNNRIRKLNLETLQVTTIAGAGVAGFKNGIGVNAEFHDPAGVAIDALGNIYVADESNHRIRRIVPSEPLQRREINLVLSITAKVEVEVIPGFPVTTTVTIPVDTTKIELGVVNKFGPRDLSGIPNGDQLDNLLGDIEDVSVNVPSEGITDDDITLHINFRNINVTDPQNPSIDPIEVNDQEIPVFFFIRMAVEKDGRFFTRFDFKDGFPLKFRLPLAKLATLLANSGFSSVDLNELVLAFSTSAGLTREGIFSAFDPASNELVVAVTHLSDLVGIRQSDIPLPAPAAITVGPVVAPDTTFATVFWRTSRASNSILKYGAAIDVLADTARTEADSLGVIDHTVVLDNLTKSTTYYYQIYSSDPFGRMVVSAVDSFRTRGIPDLADPVFEIFPSLRERSATTAGFFMQTDRRTTVVANYDTAGAPGLSQVLTDDDNRKSHLITLAGLIPGARYQVVFSATGSGTVTSDTLNFRTRAQADTLKPVFRLRRVDDFTTTDTTAIISLVSNFPVNMEVFYWAADSTDTLTEINTEPSTGPFIILTNLKPATRYVYFVRVTRPTNGQTATSQLDRFRTRRSGVFVPLRFTRTPGVRYKADKRVVFRWKTNLSSNGFVYFQLDPTGQGVFNIDESFVRGSTNFARDHRVTLPGLMPGEQYLVVITSQSPDGQFLIWPPDAQFSTKPVVVDGMLHITGIVQVPGAQGRFTTNTQPDTQAPIILNGPTVVAQTGDQLVVQWETDELSTSQVDFGTGGQLTENVSDATQVTLHQATLTNLSPNTTYDFTVSSVDPSSNGPTSSPQAVGITSITSDITPPVIDDASISTAPSDDRAIITWNTDEGADSEVQFGTHADSLETSLSEVAILTAHQITLTGLTPSTQYFYKALSTDVSGNGPTSSATRSFTTTAVPDTAQPAVSNVQTATVAQSDSTVTVTFTWTTDKLATSSVDYDTLSDLSTQVTIGTQAGATSHSVAIAGLALDETYYFLVGSSNVLDQNVPAPTTHSALDSVATPADVDLTAPAAPATATAIPGDAAVLVRWDPSTDPSGIAGYNIGRNGSTIASNVTDATYLDQTVTNGTAYSYMVTPIDNAGNVGTMANSANVTPGTDKVPGGPISGATPDTVSVRPILVVGNAVPVTGDPTRATLTYAFQIATDSLFSAMVASGSGIVEGTTSNPTHWQVINPAAADSALNNGVTYYWRARANDGAFNGAWSDTKTFVAASSKPTAVALSAMSATSDRGVVLVSWTVAYADPSHAGFHLYRSLQAGNGFVKITGDLLTGYEDTFDFRDVDVQVGQQYYYLIEAASTGGETTRFGPIQLRVDAPRTFALRQNAPNPFNPVTTIRFDLPNPVTVTMVVYNLLGQEVIRLVDNQAMEAGFHQVLWNGRNRAGRTTSSGVYIYRIQAGDFIKAHKMLLLK